MVKVVKKEERKVNTWSGGITQELYIYPESTCYEKRDFTFRISIAVTQNDCSHFTQFPHARRIISVLDGIMEIRHQDHHSIVLEKYDIDRFSGNWNTTAYGKVADFNLIIQNGSGDFFYKDLDKENQILFNSEHNTLNFIFCIEGILVIAGSEIQSGELLVTDESELSIQSNNAKIFYGYAEL